MNTVVTTHHGADRVDRNHQADEFITQNARFIRHRDGAEHINTLRRDMLDSAPNVEYYNNYSKNGLLADSIADVQPPKDTETPTANSVPVAEKTEQETTAMTYWEARKATPVRVRLYDPSISDKEIEVHLDYHITQYWITSTMVNMNDERIMDYMNQGISDYYHGRIGADEIADIAERLYKDMLEINVFMGKTDGNDRVFNEKLMQHVHGMFVSQSVHVLYQEMNNKGFEYAQSTYGFSRTSAGDRFCYYDSDYYYGCKELQALGDEFFSRIAKDEGLSGFRTSWTYENATPASVCFNSQWSMNASTIGFMKDLTLAPPKDFKMFFAPKRFSQEALDKGSYHVIEAINPSPHNSDTGTTFYIKVPKGMELWRSLPFWMTLTQVPNNYPKGNVPVAATYDISKYLTPGAGFNDSLQDFFAKYVNNFDNGVLTIWQGDCMTEYDVPFDTFFTNTRQLNGSQVVPAGFYNDFLSNFEFGIYLQR